MKIWLDKPTFSEAVEANKKRKKVSQDLRAALYALFENEFSDPYEVAYYLMENTVNVFKDNFMDNNYHHNLLKEALTYCLHVAFPELPLDPEEQEMKMKHEKNMKEE